MRDSSSAHAKKRWWQPFSGPPASLEDCREAEPWTLIDALYFCTVSMSTVGYGDFAPSSPASRHEGVHCHMPQHVTDAMVRY